jgi:hypothetical protein
MESQGLEGVFWDGGVWRSTYVQREGADVGTGEGSHMEWFPLGGGFPGGRDSAGTSRVSQENKRLASFFPNSALQHFPLTPEGRESGRAVHVPAIEAEHDSLTTQGPRR